MPNPSFHIVPREPAHMEYEDECGLCGAYLPERDLVFRDLDLGREVCRECGEALTIAELELRKKGVCGE